MLPSRQRPLLRPMIRPSSRPRSVRLEQEVAQLKLKVASLELEKLGATVNIDKGKDGKDIATVNILKKWSGGKNALRTAQERAQPSGGLY